MRHALLLVPLCSLLAGCLVPGEGGVHVCTEPALAIAGAVFAAAIEGAASTADGVEDGEDQLPPLKPGETRVLYQDNWACLDNPRCLPPDDPVCLEAPDGCCPC